MKRTAAASILAISLISAISGTGAQAATKASAGGLCAKAGTTTKIIAKSYTCTKALSGKLVWIATTGVGAKPQISGGARGDGGAGDEGGAIRPHRTTKAGKTIAPSHEAAEGTNN
jgi:hypothetical protein